MILYTTYVKLFFYFCFASHILCPRHPPPTLGPPSSVDLRRGDASADDDGLRRRNVTAASLAAPRRTSDEEDEEEEVEFHLAERKEEKRGFSLNKCIVAALVLLCLGSLFLSGQSSHVSSAQIRSLFQPVLIY